MILPIKSLLMFLFVPPTKAYTVTYNPEPLNLKNCVSARMEIIQK